MGLQGHEGLLGEKGRKGAAGSHGPEGPKGSQVSVHFHVGVNIYIYCSKIFTLKVVTEIHSVVILLGTFVLLF